MVIKPAVDATSVNIGLVQMQCEKGAVAANLERMAQHIAAAEARGVDILAFPEMSLTGYADPTRYPQAVVTLDGPELATAAALTRGLSLSALVGVIEAKPGDKPFITQVVLRDGKLAGAYRKVTIVGDETPWFAAGAQVPVFQHHALTYGLAICADIGNEQVFAAASRQGALVIFEVAAPGLYGEQRTRDWASGFAWWRGECHTYLRRYARAYGAWIVVATQAGRTVDEDFPGGGYVFAPTGECLYETADWSPGAVYLRLDLTGHRVTVL